ncbi:hypothetical protein [Nocardia sp. XZ_19_369]|uniref:hypothetical protein n=1 Tax=Nocardia sp. XZ_19_369 TaxID=2769487 RepID=UPI00188FF23A|nr:hypothetical protein [Nocardia sp. XZ_19_369]
MDTVTRGLSEQQARLPAITEPVAAFIIRWVRDKRVRDNDGLAPWGKDALDALVRAEVLPDDRHTVVAATSYLICHDPARAAGMSIALIPLPSFEAFLATLKPFIVTDHAMFQADPVSTTTIDPADEQPTGSVAPSMARPAPIPGDSSAPPEQSRRGESSTDVLVNDDERQRIEESDEPLDEFAVDRAVISADPAPSAGLELPAVISPQAHVALASFSPVISQPTPTPPAELGRGRIVVGAIIVGLFAGALWVAAAGRDASDPSPPVGPGENRDAPSVPPGPSSPSVRPSPSAYTPPPACYPFQADCGPRNTR